MTITQLIRDIDNEVIEGETISESFPNNLTGMSGRKFRTLVVELVRRSQSGCYLEIGTFRGKTILTSANANPDKDHVAVDNFSQFDKDGENLRILNEASNELTNFKIHDQDYEIMLRESRLPKAGVYFFDASHDYRSQIIALINAPRFLTEGGVILVDDTNYHHVRYASYDFVTAFPAFKLVAEIYTGIHPGKLAGAEKEHVVATWWNGVNVIVHDPDNKYENVELQWDDAIRDQLTKNGQAGCDARSIKSQIS
ncbi:MAG: class I SAM-dependent methyltransferase [Pseudomonadota bacterium]